MQKTTSAQWYLNDYLINDYGAEQLVTNGNSIYGTSGTVNQMIFSVDNGQTWKWMDPPSFYFAHPIITCNNVFVFLAGDGIYRSSDNGTNWTQVITGIPSNNKAISCIASAGGSRLYTSNYITIYKSDDDGSNWNALACAGLPNSAGIRTLFGENDFILATSNSGNIFDPLNGIYRSVDGGASFSQVSGKYLPSKFVKRGTTYYAASGGDGVIFSTDNGVSWDTLTSEGLYPTVNKVLSIETSNNIIYAGTEGGIRALFTGSNKWINYNRKQFVAHSFSDNAKVNSIAKNGTNVFIGVDAWGGTDGIYQRLLNQSVAVNDAAKNNTIHVYPNPISNGEELNIVSNSNDLLDIELTNITGATIIKKNSIGSSTIQIENLPSGMYFIRLGNEEIQYRQSVIVIP